MKTLNALAFGYAGAAISTICMLVLGIFGLIGIYAGLVEMMIQAHLFFSLSFLGIVGGMIEAAVIGFVLFYVFALIYNFFVNKTNHT